jgi:isopentenyl-diphosphate Delta-isomerase
MQITEEYLDIINLNDEVIGKATRSEIYQKLLPHRIVHVLVFNEQGKLALQQRSSQNSFLPLHWGTSSGGHVTSGESYQEAAQRELREELSLYTEIQFLFKGTYSDLLKNGLKKQIWSYKSFANGPFKCDPQEGERVEFFSLEKIQEMINSREKFMPELLFILREHFQII